MLYNGTATPPHTGVYLVQAIIDDGLHSGSARAMLTITDNTPPPLSTYTTWLQSHFTPAEIQAGAITDITSVSPATDSTIFSNTPWALIP